jgi:RNA polymerase sigma-70 factor, ECF subfamily
MPLQKRSWLRTADPAVRHYGSGSGKENGRSRDHLSAPVAPVAITFTEVRLRQESPPDPGDPDHHEPDYRDEIKDCFSTMSARVYATLRRLTRGDHQLAEDLVHDTFIKAWENWSNLRELTEEERVGWLMQVAVYTAVDVFRQNKTAREKMPAIWSHCRPPESDPYREALTSIAIKHFIKVINGMPAQRSLVAFLTWRCGWRNHEIAEVLGITPGRVSQHIRAAGETLREELGPYVPFEPGGLEGGTRP